MRMFDLTANRTRQHEIDFAVASQREDTINQRMPLRVVPVQRIRVERNVAPPRV
jgi:hypothetical protein